MNRSKHSTAGGNLAMRYKEKAIQDAVNRCDDAIINEVRKRARVILVKYPSLKEFVMGMGGWFFTNQNDEIIHQSYTDPRFTPIAEMEARWDSIFKITGTAMRFTARGREINNWGGTKAAPCKKNDK